MNIQKTLVIILGSLFFSSCTTYIYQGKINALDSAGKEREHVVHWNKTKRVIWFDTITESVTLLTECSNNAVKFDEGENGIVFAKDSDDVFQRSLSNKDCGEIIGHKHVKDIEEGPLKLTVYCKPKIDRSNEFLAAGMEYLKASATAYTFNIERKVTKNLAADTPKPRACRD